MGQYYNGSKIGTCETIYYLRLSQAERLAKQGARDDDEISFADYLKDGETKFRFPFPDEDDDFLLEDPRPDISDFNRGYLIPVGNVIDSFEDNHEEICISNQLQGGGDSVNMFIPCPYSRKFKEMGIRTSIGGFGENKVHIVMEAMRADGKNGELIKRTIYKCARCGSLFRITLEETKKLKEYLKEYYKEPTRSPGSKSEEQYNGEMERWQERQEIINRIS